MENSRTSKSLKNSIVSLVFYFINLVVQFISRKIFLDYLGADILGLNTTAQNILQFLNLAELGIGTAVGYFLYKPLRENDHNAINEIVTLQGYLYKRIAFIIVVGSILILPFFPLIFKKINLPISYAYISFGVFLFGSLLSYFVNYRQIVLSANQQIYKIQYSYQSIMILRSVSQIFVISLLDYPFEWWAINYVVFTIIGSISLHLTTQSTAPYLRKSNLSFRQLKTKYPNFSLKIKQIFFHRIGTFALGQSSSLIIYAYASLALVAYYGNYMMIFTGVTMMINALFSSVDAGIGNLVAEGNEQKILDVFKEMFSIRFAISLIICFMIYKMTPELIIIWIGKEYLLPNSTLAIMVVILFVRLSRVTIDGFIGAYGLYSDVYAPIIESCLNIGLSILLGYFLGLNGILIGVLISLFLIVGCWKPYFLFSRGFKKRVMIYISLYVHHILAGAVSWLIVSFVLSKIDFCKINNMYTFVINTIAYLIIFSITLCLILSVTNAGINKTFKRLINLNKYN